MQVTEWSNGMRTFRIRHRDRCSKYECKGNPLTVTGIREEKDRFYKIISHCDMCGGIYEFERRDRREVEK